ncbi:phage portal protein [Streptomyces sp. NPDC056210]|uniref:phage portal protein n=1 Tax=Streptomyces sp. NPDC056210 TaxID=3345746 RepID=UPI0035DB26D5
MAAKPKVDTDARVKNALAQIDKDKDRLTMVDRYVRGLHPAPFMPRNANAEFKELSKRSIHNIIPLLIDAPTDALAVEGYRRPDVTGNPDEWKYWQSNRMDQRQALIHRAALECGQAYVSVRRSLLDSKAPQIRVHPAVRTFAAFEDPLFDASPLYGLVIEEEAKGEGENATPGRATYFDEKFQYEIELSQSGFTIGKKTAHGMPVCPMIRFVPKMDLLGRAHGVVETVVQMQDKLNQMYLNLMIAQHYTGFAIRTATGLAPVEMLDDMGNPMYGEDGQPLFIPPIIDPSTMLISPNPDTTFGQLPAARTDDFMHSIELVIQHMCAVTETPPHYLLTGSLSNLSADALAAAESAFTRKVDEIRHSFGESWEQVLRLCAFIAGDQKGYEIEDAQVQWADKGNRSLAQAVDAGLKLTQMGVPTTIVLSKVPGFTQQDIDEVAALLEDQDGINNMADKFSQRVQNNQKKAEENTTTEPVKGVKEGTPTGKGASSDPALAA